jgi:putative membrane protein
MMGCDMMGGRAMMVVTTLLFVGLVIAGVWFIGRAFGGGGSRDDGGSSALRILKERYASGEIDADEFDERRGTLLR